MTEDQIKQLRNIKTRSGQYLFTTVDDFFRVAGTDVSYDEIKQLAQVTIDTGADLFTRGEDVVRYVLTKKGEKYLKEQLLNRKNPAGVQIFTDGGSVAAFVVMNGDPEKVQELADLLDENKKPLLLPHQAIRYTALGFSENELIPVDSEKANALFLIAADDYNQAFLNTQVKAHIDRLRKTYDSTLDFIAEDTAPQQEYKTLKEYSLLFLAGHGDGHRIRIGQTDDERSYFDTTDKEFCTLLDTLPPDARIFLFSCSAGFGGKTSDNFANYVATCAPERTVIASMAPMSAFNITIETEYPLTAKIEISERYPYNMDPRKNKEQINDVTYVTTLPHP